MTEENDFFRQATLCLCRSLEIETSLLNCVQFLKKHMPAHTLALQLYERNLGAMRLVAMADVTTGQRMKLLVPLPAAGKQVVHTESENFQEAFIFNRPADNPIGATMLPAINMDPLDSSLLVMPVLTESDMAEGQTRGTVVLIAKGLDQYTKDHARLLGLLIEPFSITLSNALKHRELHKLKDLLKDDNQFLQRELSNVSGVDIIGADFGLAETMRAVRSVAVHDSPVLLLGETGAGKDVIANHIHQLSPRRKGPLIKVNCGAIPDALIDSELFGHEKGAFTGAIAAKRGRFERADQGSIFLDEIGELPMPVQVRLLRVLQNNEIERVGGTELIRLDIRIIAATNRNLEEMVKQGTFREDLWFRLHVFPIEIPALRDRKEDIPALLEHVIHRKAQELKMGIPPAIPLGVIDQLTQYDWPGNIRELENVVERALILGEGKTLPFDYLLGSVTAVRKDPTVRPDVEDTRTLDQVIASHIEHTIRQTGGKIHGAGGAAKRLGVNESTLRNRMNKLGIQYRKLETEGIA